LGNELASACANCGNALAGEYCSRCGQQAIDYHRPFSALFGDVVGDVLNLDTRLIRTLRPLLFTPGAVARDYIAGRRASHVPPLKSYLIAALIFLAAHFGSYLPRPISLPIAVALWGWLFVYLPIALRRVYGGSRLMTGVKVIALGVLYALAFGASQPLIIGATLLQF
jgi:hypothetical protein